MARCFGHARSWGIQQRLLCLKSILKDDIQFFKQKRIIVQGHLFPGDTSLAMQQKKNDHLVIKYPE